MNRRLFLFKGAAFAAGAALLARAQTALAAAWPSGAFDRDDTAAAIKELFGAEKYAEDAGIEFRAPEIAENGAVVPLQVRYKGPAKAVAIFVEENPKPLAAAFELGEKGAANVGVRIKMGHSSLVHAVVQKPGGELLGTVKEVKVTIGGCGG